MSPAVFLVLVVLVLVFNFFVAGALMWLSCRIFRLKDISYRRALLAVVVLFLVNTLVSLLVGGGALLFNSQLEPPVQLAVELGLMLIGQVLTLMVLAWPLRTSILRGLGVGITYTVLSVVYAVIFVVVVKSTVCEAFMIPTGAMAPTILGHHKSVDCPQCGYRFDVNASSEVEPPPEMRSRITQATCPNCRLDVDFTALGAPPPLVTGDRILTVRHGLDRSLRRPERFDLMTFYLPNSPSGKSPILYVKRLAGLPGEVVGICGGDLYLAKDSSRASAGDYPDPGLGEKFEPDKLEIIRKPPELILALRRPVCDLDHPASDLGDQPRWVPEAGWEVDDARQPRGFSSKQTKSTTWLDYQHLLRGENKPRLITNFESYNSGKDAFRLGGTREDWVGDLILECEIAINKPEGKLFLELGRGADRFQARWDLQTGVCSLVRLKADKEEELEHRQTQVGQAGTRRLCFANVDQRLTVWVDGQLPFGAGVDYDPSRDAGPIDRDLTPARLGAQAASVRVQHLQLWRDIYYTRSPGQADVIGMMDAEDWSDPSKWESLRRQPVRIFPVKPGHYFFLGDNSTNSADSRDWGVVPESLLHGRVLFTYYPFNRAGQLR